MKKKMLFLILFVSFIFIGINVSAKEIDLDIIEHFQIADINYDFDGETNCEGYFGSVDDEDSLMHLLVVQIFRPIKWLVPILLLVFTTLDFSKVVFTDSKDGMEKAKKNFIKRAIIAVVIFFIPTLLELVFEIFNNHSINECMNNFN